MTPKITLKYKCRWCDEAFYDHSVTSLQKVEQIRMIPALMITIHQCDEKRFGVCDLIGCKVEDME